LGGGKLVLGVAPPLEDDDHLKGRMGEGVFALVQEHGALRWHRYRLKTNGFGFRPAATPFGMQLGWRKLGKGRSSVVASIVFLFSVGKREREGAPGPPPSAK